jgi:predicted transglutaminase-like cysteine proteinase
MQLNSDYYDTDFELIYKGNKILIRNDGPEGESLYVNGVLQDQNFSAHNGHLIGHIFDEDNRKEVIEVVLAGQTTADCMVYANGELIHSQIPREEFVEARKEEPKTEKKRNNLFFPFLVILLIAVAMILLLPYLEGADSSENSSDTVFQENPVSQEETIQVHYEWNYGKSTWTYDLNIPKSAYEYYKTVDRKKIHDYGYYVTDPTDDEYLAGLAAKFKEAAEKDNYSDLDMVKNIILFVQNLQYVDDKVGTGYDEYPKFPLETLADEGGDCEDSAILLASLLRELGYGTVLIQFQDHMAVGVKGESSISGSYYEVDGNRYYYVETTSTGWEIGEVPEQMADQPARILKLD